MRSRSAIIRFSARFFSSPRSSLGEAHVLGTALAPRRLVPLIGFASTQRSRPTRRKRSGEELSTAASPKRTIGGERRRVDAAQGAVEREGIRRRIGQDGVRQADLVGLAFGKQPLALGDLLQVALVRASQLEPGGVARGPHKLVERRQRRESLGGTGEPALGLLGRAGLSEAEQVGVALDVVEGDHAVGEDEGCVRQGRVVRGLSSALSLQLITEPTGKAAIELERQLGSSRRGLRKLIAQKIEDRFAPQFDLATPLDPHLTANVIGDRRSKWAAVIAHERESRPFSDSTAVQPERVLTFPIQAHERPLGIDQPIESLHHEPP